MRTPPTGLRSTSGVEPISPRRFGATALRTALEHVDRRARLAEQLADAPEQSAALGLHCRTAESLDELRLATLQPRERQQIGNGVPRAVLEHPLPPFTVELVAVHDLEPGGTRAHFEARQRHVLCARCGCSEESLCLVRFERLRGERLVDEHRAAGSQHALAFGEPAVQLHMVEHVAAPDVIERLVIERKRLERSLCNVDLVAQAFARDSLPRPLDMEWNGIDGDDATAESPNELDRVRCVARSRIEDDVRGPDV